MSDAITEARRKYEDALFVFRAARTALTAARAELARAEGRAYTTEQLAQRRAASRRQGVLRNNPQLRGIPDTATRRRAVDAVLAARDAPRVWKFYLDTMKFDPVTRTRVIRAQNRKRFELYRAGLTVAAQFLRQRARDTGSPVERARLDGNARKIELHLQTLVDVSPREVTIHYPHEWAVISSALRPEGMNPRGKGARKLYALYQHIVRTHTEEA